MTDKITTEEALAYFGRRLELGQCGKRSKQRRAFEKAIEALEQNEKLKAVIKGWYGQNGTVGVDEEVNAVSCKHCTKRIDGLCPFQDEIGCAQSDDEAIELFFKYGLE